MSRGAGLCVAGMGLPGLAGEQRRFRRSLGDGTALPCGRRRIYKSEIV